jgi:fibronectin type 3 domain-containing protein
MRYYKIQIIALACFLHYGIAYTQGQSKKPQSFKASIQLSAKVYSDSIVLRWAPDAPGAWTTANQFGYAIERTEVPATGTFDPAAYKRLNSSPVKPWPLDKWASIAGEKAENSMAAVAAQALYGKSFSSTGTSLVQMADEYSNRWSFALLAADMNQPTATALGLRFADKNIKNGNVYIYRVLCLADTSLFNIETGYTVANTADVIQIPVPLISKATEMENAIKLEWDRTFHEKAFSAYWIERSGDLGKTYNRLTKVPFLNPQNDMREKSSVFLYTDSLKENYKPFIYRIIGITSFGEVSKPSQAVTAMGRDKTPPAAPEKVKAESTGGSVIKLSWEKKSEEKDLKGFIIGRSSSSSDGFQPLFENPLPPSARSWTDPNADVTTTNYYVVAAVDTAGNGNVSMISYGMIVDSIPPAPPVNLKGSIDSLGIVRISWNFGREPDLAGYMVYFSNDSAHIFSSTTPQPLRDTTYTDTITLKTLSKRIYFKIKSVDVTYNYSPFSALLELRKPDKLPPTSPVISSYKVMEDGIRIDWISSQSEDVTEHILFRRINKENWTEYRKFPKAEVSTLTDKDVKPGSDYSYKLISVDESGNKSKPSVEMTLKFTGSLTAQSVSNIFVSITSNKNGILVNWNYPVEGNYRFVVYRAVNGGNFLTVETTEQRNTSFTDKNVKTGFSYEYQVRAFFKDGKKSALGKVAQIIYNQ